MERTRGPVEQALSDAKLSADDIDEVILVGGSTRIPAVQELVRRLTKGKEPNMTVNPDEVVAIGAALQAGVLKGEVEDVVLLDVTPLSLGLETLGGVMTKVIERNTTIPARRTETFSTAEDNQSAVDIVVLQGERELAADNRQLARFRLEGIQPAPRGVPQIEVTFDIDANGILNVSARDKQTGKEQRVTIQESTNLDPAEIERMVADAQAHAGEDRQRREEIDARNELDSLAYRVDQLVTELQDQLPVNDKARAEQLVADARQAIQEQAGLDRVRPLIADLQQLVHSLPASASAARAARRRRQRRRRQRQPGRTDRQSRTRRSWMPSSHESDAAAGIRPPETEPRAGRRGRRAHRGARTAGGSLQARARGPRQLPQADRPRDRAARGGGPGVGAARLARRRRQRRAGDADGARRSVRRRSARGSRADGVRARPAGGGADRRCRRAVRPRTARGDRRAGVRRAARPDDRRGGAVRVRARRPGLRPAQVVVARAPEHAR